MNFKSVALFLLYFYSKVVICTYAAPGGHHSSEGKSHGTEVSISHINSGSSHTGNHHTENTTNPVDHETTLVHKALVRIPLYPNNTNKVTDNQVPQRPEDQETEIKYVSPIKQNSINATNDLLYSRGYFGGYYNNGPNRDSYFVHGLYQKPADDYYRGYHHELEDTSALSYYLGYGMTKLNHTEYFQHQHFTHYNLHHYFYKNNVLLREQSIRSDHLVPCPRNTAKFCPENTETVCTTTATIMCASKLSAVKLCKQYSTLSCVTTRVPCKNQKDPKCKLRSEILELPCMSNITIIDINVDRHGYTFKNVAGTFVLAPVPSNEERTICVTVLLEPVGSNDV